MWYVGEDVGLNFARKCVKTFTPHSRVTHIESREIALLRRVRTLSWKVFDYFEKTTRVVTTIYKNELTSRKPAETRKREKFH